MQSENLRAQAEMQQQAIANEGKMAEAQIDAQIKQLEIRKKQQIDAMDREIQFSKSEIERGKLINQRHALLWQMRKETKELLNNKAAQPNPTNRLSQVIANDRYGMIPGQAG